MLPCDACMDIVKTHVDLQLGDCEVQRKSAAP